SDDAATLARTGEIIERQAIHMSKLVDDLLDVSRVTRGKFNLEKERFPLSRALRSAEETVRPMLEARAQQLALSTPDGDVALDADPTRLEQVLSNLLHNASKFSPEGSTVRLSARVEGALLELAVEDAGAGIEPDALGRVFDPFFQASRTVDRSLGGLGVGLTLVKTIAELHGGTVGAYSEGPGRGARFVVRLPVVRGTFTTSTAAPAPPAPPRLRVLVVDDNVDAAEMMRELLLAWGHDAEMVHDGRAALEAVERLRPDVTLLDIGLPEYDGHEVARQVRSDVRLDAVRLYALTGYGADADVRRSREAGFDGHLVKPVDLEVLRRLLADLPPRAAT
ncbi:MAG: ATP-binding protein, partial [Myxococcales bacterium]